MTSLRSKWAASKDQGGRLTRAMRNRQLTRRLPGEVALMCERVHQNLENFAEILPILAVSPTTWHLHTVQQIVYQSNILWQ
jgi:hypothetical protein